MRARTPPLANSAEQWLIFRPCARLLSRCRWWFVFQHRVECPVPNTELAEFVSCLSVCSSDIYEPFLAVLYVLFLIKPASWSQLACSVQILETENLLSVALAFQVSILWVSKDTETDCVLLKEELKALSSFSHPHVIPNCMTCFLLWDTEVLYHLWAVLFHTGFDEGRNIPSTERNYCVFHKWEFGLLCKIIHCITQSWNMIARSNKKIQRFPSRRIT